MKRKLLISMCLLMISGCAALTPRQECRLAQLTFRDTNEALLLFKDKFDTDEIEDIKALTEAGTILLEKWTQAVIAKEPVTMRQAFEAVLDELLKYKLKGRNDE